MYRTLTLATDAPPLRRVQALEHRTAPSRHPATLHGRTGRRPLRTTREVPTDRTHPRRTPMASSVLDRSGLEQSPLADLHLIANELGVDGFRRLRKSDLVDAILARQEGTAGDAAAPEA